MASHRARVLTRGHRARPSCPVGRVTITGFQYICTRKKRKTSLSIPYRPPQQTATFYSNRCWDQVRTVMNASTGGGLPIGRPSLEWLARPFLDDKQRRVVLVCVCVCVWVSVLLSNGPTNTELRFDGPCYALLDLCRLCVVQVRLSLSTHSTSFVAALTTFANTMARSVQGIARTTRWIKKNPRCKRAWSVFTRMPLHAACR